VLAGVSSYTLESIRKFRNTRPQGNDVTCGTRLPQIRAGCATLNEAPNIEPLLKQLVASLLQTSIPWQILVVGDKSSDGTPDVVRRFAESEARVRLLVRAGQRGLAGAIRYEWAHSDANLLGVIDADLQHPPELLPTLISCDIAIASRY
jgi:dolichol-phosphate mannosyltransferase